MDKIDFIIEIPDGKKTKKIKSIDLKDNQYRLAVGLQQIQNKVDKLKAYVEEFSMAQDHFRLKQKEFIDSL